MKFMKSKNLKELKVELSNLFEKITSSVDSLYEIATHDEKTGIYNNKFFSNILDIEIAQAKRGLQKLSLIIVDIDFFKKINDVHGHFKADDLLKKLAEVLKKTTRKSDIVARFGGEEFVILLPSTSLNKAKKLAERIKKAIHSNRILKKYNLTVSGGVTEFKKTDNKNSFQKRADKGLYSAKKSGRDRFISI
jgi:diguanylate cyclase (GGDEF)-like protein